MDEGAAAAKPTRRVGVNEGLQYMFGAAVALLAVARPFEGMNVALALAAGALTWALGYLALRLARRRLWFGGWDALSFLFVWGYSTALALGAQMLVFHWD